MSALSVHFTPYTPMYLIETESAPNIEVKFTGRVSAQQSRRFCDPISLAEFGSFYVNYLVKGAQKPSGFCAVLEELKPGKLTKSTSCTNISFILQLLTET